MRVIDTLLFNIKDNKMIQESENIEALISKEEQRNIYLSELVQNLEKQLLKSKSPQPKLSIPLNSAELHIAQLKTVTKRIEIYKEEIAKINSLNTHSVLQEYHTCLLQIEKY